MYEPEKFTPATIEFVDIAGLVKGAPRARVWETNFSPTSGRWTLSSTWSAAFVNDDIVHVDGSIDPRRDIETIDLELILFRPGGAGQTHR